MEFLQCRKYGKYEVSREGVIRVIKTKQVLKVKDLFGIPYVTIMYGKKTVTLKVAYMVAATYLPAEPGKRELKCLDGDWSNFDPANYEWYNLREEIEKNSEGENWKMIDGYNKIYEICEDGRIRRYEDGELITPSKKDNGVLGVRLWKNGECKAYNLAKLVALHFLTGKPKYTVYCLDGDNSNVHCSNLAWGRPKKENKTTPRFK